MGRRILFFLCLIVIAGLVGFLVYYNNPTPERTVYRVLRELQSGDLRGADRYTINGLGLNADNRRAKKLYKAMYSTMQFVVVDSTKTQETAQVSVTVTMVDMEQQVTAASYRLLNSNLSDSSSGSKALYNLLIEQIAGEGAETTTLSAIVVLVRDEKGRWRIDAESNSEFLLAVTGGVGPF